MLILAARRNYALNNEYALNNKISVHHSLHSCSTFVYCIVGVMATQTEETFSIVGVARGHHVYKSVRTPLLGESLSVRPETGNNHDKYAVSIVKCGGIVCNFPHKLLRTGPCGTLFCMEAT